MIPEHSAAYLNYHPPSPQNLRIAESPTQSPPIQMNFCPVSQRARVQRHHQQGSIFHHDTARSSSQELFPGATHFNGEYPLLLYPISFAVAVAVAVEAVIPRM